MCRSSVIDQMLEFHVIYGKVNIKKEFEFKFKFFSPEGKNREGVGEGLIVRDLLLVTSNAVFSLLVSRDDEKRCTGTMSAFPSIFERPESPLGIVTIQTRDAHACMYIPTHSRSKLQITP